MLYHQRRQGRCHPRNTDLRQTRVHAFTLVEMLVVLAIVSTLAAMLFPTVQRSIGAARSVQCSNNLRQVGVSFGFYVTDYRGALPLAHQGVFETPTVWGRPCWIQGMMPEYFTPEERAQSLAIPRVDIGILNCPSHPAKFPVGWIYAINQHTSYGMNTLGIGGGYAGASWCRAAAYRKITQVRYPDRQLAFADSQYPTTAMQFPDGNSTQGYFTVSCTAFEGGLGFRHEGSTNLAFVDGHCDGRVREAMPSYTTFTQEESMVLWSNP